MPPIPAYLIDTLFSGDSVMRTLFFASGSGTNFREAIRASQETDANYSPDLLIVDKLREKGKEDYIGAINFAEDYDTPWRHINGYSACGSRKVAEQTPKGLEEYDRRCTDFNGQLLEEVERFEENGGIVFDFAVLAGYMRIVKDPLLARFLRRMINVHPAYLAILNPDGTRKYVGENAVYDALAAGETRTRSSIILVEPSPPPDKGAVLVSGHWLEYGEGYPITQDKADAHQKKQKAASDWPALRFALKAISNGEFGLHRRKFHHDGNPVVVYRGEEMPYEGYVMPYSETSK